jgi:hypothetical protein
LSPENARKNNLKPFHLIVLRHSSSGLAVFLRRKVIKIVFTCFVAAAAVFSEKTVFLRQRRQQQDSREKERNCFTRENAVNKQKEQSSISLPSGACRQHHCTHAAGN